MFRVSAAAEYSLLDILRLAVKLISFELTTKRIQRVYDEF